MDLEIGQRYKVTITRILRRGIIVQINGTEFTEFIHISKLSDRFVANISDIVTVGDVIDATAVPGAGDRPELSLQSKSLYTNVKGNHPTKQQRGFPSKKSNPTLDEMIAAVDVDFKEKQRIRNAGLQRRRRSRHRKDK